MWKLIQRYPTSFSIFFKKKILNYTHFHINPFVHASYLRMPHDDKLSSKLLFYKSLNITTSLGVHAQITHVLKDGENSRIPRRNDRI
jgi:hypothetical protein